jgi:capsular exopolysaccharide synthesis family protein
LLNDPEWFAPSGQPAVSRFLSLNGSRSNEPVVQSVNQSFLDSLNVQPITGSYVLSLRFKSRSPEKAARIANAFAKAYLDLPVKATPEEEVEGQKAMALYNRIAASEEQLKSLTQARLSPPAEREELLRERDELAKRYGPLHPRMIDINGKLAKLDAEGTSPAPAITALKAELAQLREELATRTTRQKADLEKTRGKMVSAAATPTRAERELPDWLLGSIPGLGLLLGLFLALLNDRYDRGFRTDHALEEETGLSTLGTIPVLLKPEAKTAAHVLQKPSSGEAEAVRALRTGLRLTGEKEGRPLKVITITSSHQDDPRTLLAVWLARLAARSGEKVLLLDADLRQPQAHVYLGHSNTPSLVDYLTGHNHLEQIIWKQDSSGMHVIFGSPVPNTALDLVSSEKMRKMMGYLRQGYDFIVVCAPPCLTSADAALLANESDQALYLVTARTTYRSTVRKGLKLFADFGYKAVSLALLTPKKI